VTFKLCENYELPLHKKEIITISDYYFHINPLSDYRLEIQNLGSNKELSKDPKDKSHTNTTTYPVKFIFELSEFNIVTIGRDPKCSIAFPGDQAFSKIHTTFLYDNFAKCWKMKDGSVDKSSTNGTWVYATHSYEIRDNFCMKIGDSKLRLIMG